MFIWQMQKQLPLQVMSDRMATAQAPASLHTIIFKNYFPHVKVDLYLEPIPNIFKFMKRSEEILSEWPDDRKYDLFIAQDCGDAKRLGNAAKYFESAEHTICVDHHVSNQNFAEHNYIFPDASSTCELIFELLPDERIDREIAECIYTGMVHDTGVFQYSCTSRKTMEIAGKLIEKGINFPKIVDETFFTKTYNQNRIMGLALMKSVLHLDGKCISSVITKQEMQEYDVLPKHLDGIVSHLPAARGVRDQCPNSWAGDRRPAGGGVVFFAPIGRRCPFCEGASAPRKFYRNSIAFSVHLLL